MRVCCECMAGNVVGGRSRLPLRLLSLRGCFAQQGQDGGAGRQKGDADRMCDGMGVR